MISHKPFRSPNPIFVLPPNAAKSEPGHRLGAGLTGALNGKGLVTVQRVAGKKQQSDRKVPEQQLIISMPPQRLISSRLPGRLMETNCDVASSRIVPFPSQLMTVGDPFQESEIG